MFVFTPKNTKSPCKTRTFRVRVQNCCPNMAPPAFIERATLRQIKLRLCGGNSPYVWTTLAVPGISSPGGGNPDRCDLIASLHPPPAALRLFAYRLRPLSRRAQGCYRPHRLEINKKQKENTIQMDGVSFWLPLLGSNQRHCGRRNSRCTSEFRAHPIDSCGARDFFACRRKSRPLRPHRLASSATGGASALRLPTSPAQSTSTRLLSAASAGDQQETKRKHHPNGWCFFLAPPVGLEPTTLRLTAACSAD